MQLQLLVKLVIEGQVKNIYILLLFLDSSATPTNRSLVYLLIIFFFCAELMPKAAKHTGSFEFEAASCSAADIGRVISKEPLQIAHLYPMSV